MIRARAILSVVTSILLLVQPGMLAPVEGACRSGDKQMHAAMTGMGEGMEADTMRERGAGEVSVGGDKAQDGVCPDPEHIACVGMGACTSPIALSTPSAGERLHTIIRSFRPTLATKPISHTSSPAVPPPRA